MRRPLAALMTGLIVAAPVPALAMQTAPTARVTSPANGQAIEGTVTARGEGSATAGVRRIQLFIAGAMVAGKEPSDVRQKVDVDHSWDTSVLQNGVYQVRVVVTATGGGEAAHAITVKVDNAPTAPTNVTHSVKGQILTLSWSPNPESDITGYRIEVATGDAWSVVEETTSTSYRAEVPPGTYEYRVTALRSSPTMEGGKPSTPSDPIAVTIAGPSSSAGSGPDGSGTNGKAKRRLFGRDGRATAGEVLSTARNFAGSGVSFGGISLPGQIGVPSLPGSQPIEWGTYKQKLPYSLPPGGVSIGSAPPSLAAFSSTRMLPLDALRWVAVGILMIAVAAMLQFIARRPEVAAVSFADAIVRLRRVQDRVRTAWEETRRR